MLMPGWKRSALVLPMAKKPMSEFSPSCTSATEPISLASALNRKSSKRVVVALDDPKKQAHADIFELTFFAKQDQDRLVGGEAGADRFLDSSDR